MFSPFSRRICGRNFRWVRICWYGETRIRQPRGSCRPTIDGVGEARSLPASDCQRRLRWQTKGSRSMLPAAFAPVAAVLASTGVPHAPVPAPDPGARVVKIARTFLHTPYALGRREPRVPASTAPASSSRSTASSASSCPHQSDQLWHSLVPRQEDPQGRHRRLRQRRLVRPRRHLHRRGRFIHAVGRGKGVRIGYLHGTRAHRGYLGAVRPKLRLHAARQAGNAVEHARTVRVRREWIHDRDTQYGVAF